MVDEHRAGVALGRGQRALVEPARLVGTSARQPHVRQHDGRAELVRDHAGRAQAGDRLGERVHRGAEVAGGPGRQAEEAGGGAAREVVLRPGQRERPAGVRDRAVDVAAGLGDRGAVDRDHGREGAELAAPGRAAASASEPAVGMVDGGVVSRPASAASSHASTPSRSPSESRLQPMKVASSGRRRTTSSGSAASQSRRVRSWRRRRRSASASSTRSAACSCVAAGERVPDGVGQQAVLGVPVGWPRACSSPTRSACSGGQPGAQRVGEEVVVAVPPALVVERDDEQVLALEGLEHRLTVGAAGQRVAEAAGQLVEHGGVEQERAHLVRLAVQHLLDEVVEDEPVAAGEGLDEPGDVAGRGRRAVRADSAASCSPAAHPSVRASSAATCAGSSRSPITSLRNASASSAVNRRSAARSSTARRAHAAATAAAAGRPAWSSPG